MKNNNDNKLDLECIFIYAVKMIKLTFAFPLKFKNKENKNA